jgi:hypothetical protein
MKIKLAISTIAACALIGGTAMAEGPKSKKHQNRDRAAAASVSGGVAAAGPRGAVAGGAAGSQAMRDTSGRTRSGRVLCVPGTASTSTSGAVYTDRRSGSAAINTNGTAAGSGTVTSSSEGEVYSSTDRSGSQADAYGNSTAGATASRRC